MELNELRYEISDWTQATECLSNNSRQLSIEVSKLIRNKRIRGTRISVVHPEFGNLFTAIVQAAGSFITDHSESGLAIPEMTTSEILTQLSRFGFNIIYVQEKSLPGPQLAYLMKLVELGYDKITKVIVRSRVDGNLRDVKVVVAIDTAENQDLIHFETVLTEVQFAERASKGTIFNLTEPSKELNFEWDWLSYTIAIEDILEANLDKKKPVHEAQPASPTVPDDYDESSFHVYGEVEIIEDDDPEGESEDDESE